MIVLGTFAFALLGYVGRVYAARKLTVAQFGDFNLGLALAGLLSLVALFGLPQAVARTIAQSPDPARRRRVIRFGAMVTGVTAVSSSLLVYFFASTIASVFDPAQHTELTAVFQLFSVTVGVTLVSTFLAAIFQGFEDTFPYAWLNQAVQPAAFLVFIVIFISFHLALEGALLAWVFSNLATFTALAIYLVRRLPKHLEPGPVAKELPAGLLPLSFALWGVTTLAFVTGYVDTLILGAFRPAGQVGIYSAVLTLARVILVAAAAVTYIFLPVAARLHGRGDLDTLKEMFATTARWMMILTVPMFFIFALLPVDSMTSLFGQSYAAGSTALVLVTVGALVSVLFGPVNAAQAGMGHTRPLLISTGISAGANVALSFALIPTYGLIGAALAWTVARILYPGTSAVQLYLGHDIQPLRRSFVLPLVLSLGVGTPLILALSLVPHPTWLIFPILIGGLGLCIVTVLATRSVEPGDFVMCRIAEGALGRPLPRLRRLMERSTHRRTSDAAEGLLAP